MNPQRPKYFIEHNGNWNCATISGRDLRRMPCAYAFAGIPFGNMSVRNNQIGPDKTMGVLIVPSGELEKDYRIDQDEWFPITPTGTPGIDARCWFGYPKDAPKPGPTEFLRDDIPTGSEGIDHPLKRYKLGFSERFGDGNIWEVPVARRFNWEKTEEDFALRNGSSTLHEMMAYAITFSDDGELRYDSNEIDVIFRKTLFGSFAPNMPVSQVFQNGRWEYGNPCREYREIWELALKVDRLFEQTQPPEEAEEIPGPKSNEAKNIAVRILQIFYNIGPDEAGWLEIFSEELFLHVLRRFCDYEMLDIWRKKKWEEALVKIVAEKYPMPESISNETEPSNSGSMDDLTDTPPPSGN